LEKNKLQDGNKITKAETGSSLCLWQLHLSLTVGLLHCVRVHPLTPYARTSCQDEWCTRLTGDVYDLLDVGCYARRPVRADNYLVDSAARYCKFHQNAFCYMHFPASEYLDFSLWPAQNHISCHSFLLLL